jgi:hypothetical protein
MLNDARELALEAIEFMKAAEAGGSDCDEQLENARGDLSSAMSALDDLLAARISDAREEREERAAAYGDWVNDMRKDAR